MTDCPCGTKTAYAECCEPVIRGARPAGTAEQLMRARYSAHAQEEIDFLVRSVDPTQRKKVDRDAVEAWSHNSIWEGIDILGCEAGGEGDDVGWVEFVARYSEGGNSHEHHERAAFVKKDGEWFFDLRNTTTPRMEPLRVEKVGRNDPCPCGSGKKYKKCCGG